MAILVPEGPLPETSRKRDWLDVLQDEGADAVRKCFEKIRSKPKPLEGLAAAMVSVKTWSDWKFPNDGGTCHGYPREAM